MSPGQPFKPPGGLVPAREGGGSLGGEGGEEVARRLPSGVPLLLELLDVGPMLLDLALLLAKLLQVAPAQVGPRPPPDPP
jgi:hypothetical protein